ncbi:MAG: acyl carrier protein [Enterovibrio sp.]
MNNGNIRERIEHLILENTFYVGTIDGDQDLFLEIGFDSLSFSALIIEIEREFNISITENDIKLGANTLNLLNAIVMRKMDNNGRFIE